MTTPRQPRQDNDRHVALPRHPHHDEEEPTVPADGPSPRRSQMLIGAAAALVILILALHLSGVIGGH